MPDIKEILTRKIGPLPTYAWGGVGIGGILIARRVLSKQDASGGLKPTEDGFISLFDGAFPVDVTGRADVPGQDPFISDPFFEPAPTPPPDPIPEVPPTPPPTPLPTPEPTNCTCTHTHRHRYTHHRKIHGGTYHTHSHNHTRVACGGKGCQHA